MNVNEPAREGGGGGEGDDRAGEALVKGAFPEPPAIPEELLRPVEHPILERDKSGPRPIGALGEIAPALALGFDFLFTIAAGGFLGWLVDYGVKSGPIGVLVGLFIGFLAATVRLIRRTQQIDQRSRIDLPVRRGSGPGGQGGRKG